MQTIIGISMFLISNFLIYYFADDSDLDRVFKLPPITFIGGDNSELPLRDIINRLEVRLQHVL